MSNVLFRRYTNAKVGNTKTVTECPISKEPSPLSDEDSLLESNNSSQFSMEFIGVTTEELSAQTEECSGKEQELLSEGQKFKFTHFRKSYDFKINMFPFLNR